MTTTPVPGPPIPTGLVIHPALEMFADGDDPGTDADLHLIVGLTVRFVPEVKAVVWSSPSGDVSLRPAVITGKYNEDGQLVLLRRDQTASSLEGVRLAVTDDPAMSPTGWKWRAEWEGNAFPPGRFSVSAGQVFNLSTVVLGASLPAPAPGQVDQLLLAYTDLRQLILDNPGGGGGVANWDTIQGRPVVVAGGASRQAARASIDLGNVDNTSDAAKPVSTAMQAALNAKANASSLTTKANSAPTAPGTFWGVWAAGSAPTPTGPGPHWGIEV